MSVCGSISAVHRLHDGEVSPGERAATEQHLAGCAECSAELAHLQEVHEQIDALFAPIRLTSIERARLDQRLDRHRVLADATDQGWADLARMARVLSTVAASILLISFVWLYENPSRHTTIVSPAVVVLPARDRDTVLANSADVPAWERAALTLRVDPRPEDARGGPFNIGVADARSINDNSPDGPIADWIVAGLTSSSFHAGGHSNAYR